MKNAVGNIDKDDQKEERGKNVNYRKDPICNASVFIILLKSNISVSVCMDGKNSPV